MDAIFCITFSIIILRMWWKHTFPDDKRNVVVHKELVNKEVDPELRKKRELEIQRELDAIELRKQGYSDELIATILPVINDGQ